MIDVSLIAGTALVAWLVTGVSATAHQVVREISWHDLEEYCLQKRSDRFGVIFDSRYSIALGTLLLMVIAAGLAISCTCYVWFAEQTLSPSRFWSFVAMVCFGYVFAGCLIPWAISQVSATPFLFHTWRIWWLVSGLAWPFIVSAEFFEQTLSRASGLSDSDQDQLEEEAAEDEIMSIVAEAKHDGHIDEGTRHMIEGVMELDDSDVGQVMTPRSRVDALDIQTAWEEMVTYVVQSGRTRIPVYQGNFDSIVGILYAKDLLRETLRSESKRRPLRKLIRKPLQVPETTRLDEMLQQFLQQHVHMAIVKDEYGGVAGVVTIEDVLEEIVGEIVDEADIEEFDQIRKLDESSADVAGTTHVSRLNEALGLKLPEDQEFDTVAGLIMKQINEIPRPGRNIVMDNVLFRVEQATRRRIERVLVQVISNSKTVAGNSETD